MAINANAPTRQHDDPQPLGRLVREWRQEAGLSQQRAAELAGCSISTVRLIEKGWTPSEEMLEKLSAVLLKSGRSVSEVDTS